MKLNAEPIVMVTAYDFPSAQVAEAAGVDIVLVGDSAAMTVLGYASTVPVSMDEMLMLATAVRRGLRTPLLVGDLPFGSYELSNEQAIATAMRFVKEAGCDVVKLERGGASVERARAIIRAGIPVMGHVGLTPQTATALGGFKAQGKTADRAVEDRRGGAGAAGGGLLRDRLRGGAGGGQRGAGAEAERAGDRDRRRRRRPTARCWSGTTCSGSTAATRRSSSSATPSCASRWSRGRRLRARGARARLPGPEHSYAIEPAELEAFRRYLEHESLAGDGRSAATGRRPRSDERLGCTPVTGRDRAV